MSAVSLLSLPDDILCHIFQYLTFSTTILCHQICKYFREFLDSHPILYKYYLQKQYFPGYEPFRKRKNMTTFEEKSILTKWFKRQFHWTKISQQQHQNSPADYHEIYGRYLHRSAIIQLPNHDESYDSIVTFGGVTDHGLSCELMSISLHENELSFNKIIYQDPEMVQEIDHTPININPLTPSNNSAYGLCSDVHSNVYMYGGRNLFLRNSGLQSQFDNTLWKYNITRNEWTNLSSYLRPQGSPPGCWGHVLVLYENCLFLFGGSSILGTYRDLWMLNLDHLQNEINQITSENLNPSQLISEHWKLIPLPDDAGPAARGGHGAVLMGSFLYIFGGNNLTDTFSDFWKIDLAPIVQCYQTSSPIDLPESVRWIELPNESPHGDYPSPRIGHTMTQLGLNYFILYGGRNYLGGTMADGVFLYDVQTNIWSNITPRGDIENRTGHCCLPTSKGLMYFGGLTGSQHVTSDIVFLDLFSPYEMNYNPLRNQYEYILPSSSQLVNNSQSYTIYQLITNSITTLLPTSTSSSYCPITIRENL